MGMRQLIAIGNHRQLASLAAARCLMLFYTINQTSLTCRVSLIAVDVHLIAAYQLVEKRRWEVEEFLRKAGASHVIVQDQALRSYVHSKTGEVRLSKE